MHFLDIVPVSAKKGTNINTIKSIIHKYLPEGIHLFPESYITNQSQNFIISEIIREKLIRFLGAEIPYSINVEIECFQINKLGSYDISAKIIVQREGQKKIIIGSKGDKIKIISIEARKSIQKTFKVPIYLRLWVKLK